MELTEAIDKMSLKKCGRGGMSHQRGRRSEVQFANRTEGVGNKINLCWLGIKSRFYVYMVFIGQYSFGKGWILHVYITITYGLISW